MSVMTITCAKNTSGYPVDYLSPFDLFRQSFWFDKHPMRPSPLGKCLQLGDGHIGSHTFIEGSLVILD